MPHLDPKGWSEGLSATNPVVRGHNLYGCGANDDNYDPFLIISSIKYLIDHKLDHPQITMILETGEESGGDEITRYFTELKDQLPVHEFIFILDGTVWITTRFRSCVSLSGIVSGKLTMQHLSAPCHSGMATARILLSRIENTANVPNIPEYRIEQVRKCADVCGSRIKYAFNRHPEILSSQALQLLDAAEYYQSKTDQMSQLRLLNFL